MQLTAQKSLGVIKRSLTPNKPYHAQWLLTRRCNYRCRGCNVWRDQENRQKEATTEEVKNGLDALRNLGVVEIVLSGGNPLLRDDIEEILKHSSRHFITTIYDNGSVAPKKLDALKYADFVSISLDTLDEKKFDYIRGVKGAWANSMNAIETLQSEGINVGVSPTISQLNINEIVDFTRYFTDRKVPVWYCLYSYDLPTESSMFTIGKKLDDFEIKDRQTMAKVCDQLKQLKKERQGVFITTKTLEALKVFFLTGQRPWTCKALQSFVMVDSLGRVAGCHRQEPLCSISELNDLWSSPRFDNMRRKNNSCEKCTYLCYIFYSLHGKMQSNLGVVWDQRRNVRSLLSRSHQAHSRPKSN
jgi:MoaA/NifB/PqqE/SkfB family radical SAM enzyme